MIRKYYSPEGDGGGMSAPADTGATDSAGAADATAADTSGWEGGNEGDATSDSTETQGVAAATMPDFKAIHERAAKGEAVPEEHLDAYEQWLSNGKPEQEATEPEQQAEPEQPKEPEIPEYITAAMKVCGAKTPQELESKYKGLLSEFNKKCAAISGYDRLVNECKAGSQAALAEFQRIYGFNPVAAQKAEPPAAAPPPQAPSTQPRQGVFSKDMFMNEEEGELFLNEYNSLKSKLADYDKRFENFEKIRATMEQREMEADKRKIQSGIMDDICDLAELCKEDFGLSNVPIRSAIEQLFTTGSLGEKEVLKPFADYLTLYAGREPKYDNLSIKEYYKLLNFDKVKGKIAQARIDASKAATSKALAVKPTVGVAGVGQKIAAPNLSDKELEAYYKGTKDIPDEWLEDGMPNNKMPAKLKSILLGQAA